MSARTACSVVVYEGARECERGGALCVRGRHRHADAHRERGVHIHTGRESARWSERQSQTDRQTETETETERSFGQFGCFIYRRDWSTWEPGGGEWGKAGSASLGGGSRMRGTDHSLR
eukprot:1922285-Rhodomonas_salina.1